MKRGLLAAAVVVILVANGWALIKVQRNRSQPLDPGLELTERELPLGTVAVESTAVVLRLNWNINRSDDEEDRSVMWLNATKLAELGFDCGVPVTSPKARHHYSSMPARPVFLALEYEGDAWKNSAPKAKAGTRLFVVDATQDARRLREQYADPRRYIVCRGLVRLHLQEHDPHNRTLLKSPRIEGWVTGIVPGQVFVPKPHNQVLKTLRRTGSERGHRDPQAEPRYAVHLRWGASYEPWVESVRLLQNTNQAPMMSQH